MNDEKQITEDIIDEIFGTIADAVNDAKKTNK